MRQIQIVFSILFLLLITGLSAQAQVENSNPAPDFTLTDTTGKSHHLSDFKGKFVVLEWYNPNCPFVVKHYSVQNMQNLQKKYTAQSVVWLTINSSAAGKEGNYPAKELSQIMQKSEGSPTALLLDGDGKVGKLYGAKTTPHMFIINPAGVLIYQGAIDSIASADSADITKSENYVTQALDEAMANKPVTTASTKSYGCSVKY